MKNEPQKIGIVWDREGGVTQIIWMLFWTFQRIWRLTMVQKISENLFILIETHGARLIIWHTPKECSPRLEIMENIWNWIARFEFPWFSHSKSLELGVLSSKYVCHVGPVLRLSRPQLFPRSDHWAYGSSVDMRTSTFILKFYSLT